MAQIRIKTHLVNAASMGATVHGAGLHIAGFVGVSFVSTYAGGTPTGTFTYEVSNDSTDGVNGTWTTYAPDKGTITNPAGGGEGADLALQFAPIYFEWIRPVFTRVSGTGTWDVWAMTKQNP